MYSDPHFNLKPNICYLATVTNIETGTPKTFGILEEDRRRHMYILGKTGMGKTTLLLNMALQDIYNNKGLCFIDPHGDSAEYILDRIPKHRQQDIVYFNPADTDSPIGLNIFEAQNDEEKFLIASQLLDVFKKIWSGAWSARMEYILNNTILALLEYPNSTLINVVKILTDNKFRKTIVDNIQDPLVKNFWLKEFNSFNSRYRQEAISPILNKIGQFLATDLIRNIVGQKTSSINFRNIMDEGKILIVNLSKGKLGEENSNLLGSLVVSQIQLAALARSDMSENQRKDFYLYVDEFQNFTTDSFATILSEARKYRLNLIIAHQYIDQLVESGNTKVKNAILGNVGTIVVFRLGNQDAKVIGEEFSPVFAPEDLQQLDRTQIALTLSIKGKRSKPFLAFTLAPIFENLNGNLPYNIDYSRNKYGRNKALVQKFIENDFKGIQSESLPELEELPDSDSLKLPIRSTTPNLQLQKNQALEKAKTRLQQGTTKMQNQENINIIDEDHFTLP